MSFRPIFYDTETTGTQSDKDKIIEIAAFDPVQNRFFEMLVNLGIPIPKESMAISGITDEMVRDAEPFHLVGKKFIEFCSGKVALIAHNNDNFDLLFLRKECQRAQLELPLHWIYIDSLKWARRYRKDLPRHSLQYLRQMYSVEEKKAHRALNDVLVLMEVFQRMTDDLSIETIYSMLQRVEASSSPSPVSPTTQLPQRPHQKTFFDVSHATIATR